VTKHPEPAGQLVDVVNLMDAAVLYDHMVNDHGWENRPYLVNQRLPDLHRLEHTEADLGLVSLTHSHKATAAAAPVTRPPGSNELSDKLS
jgi:hypothetical protein